MYSSQILRKLFGMVDPPWRSAKGFFVTLVYVRVAVGTTGGGGAGRLAVGKHNHDYL